MEKKDPNDLNENDNDAIFKQIADIYAEETMDSEPNELYDLNEFKDHQFSDDFEKRMQAIIKRDKRTRRVKRINKHSKKIAATVAVILIFISVSSIKNVSAFKINLFSLFFTEKSDHVSITRNIDDFDYFSTVPDDWEFIYVPEYVPESFDLKEAIYINEWYTLIYENNENNNEEQIVFKQIANLQHRKDISSDNERNDNAKIHINDTYPATVTYNSNETINITWNNDLYDFVLSSDIMELEKELIELAESVKIRTSAS